MTLQPSIIFVVGPSGAGKTEFSRYWRELFGQYKDVDDLPIIQEYLDLDRIIIEETTPLVLRRKLLDFDTKAIYLNDLVRLYLHEIALTGNVPVPKYCSRIDTGGMEIVSPSVWDDVIIRLARSLRESEQHIVQVARGHDAKYLQHFGIDERGIYQRVLDLFTTNLRGTLANRIALVHVSADFQARSMRNEFRRTVTGQHVPRKVMSEVFERDIFEVDEVNAIPVVSVDNGVVRSAPELASFMTEAASRAMTSFIQAFSGKFGCHEVSVTDLVQGQKKSVLLPTSLLTLDERIKVNPVSHPDIKLIMVAHLLDTTGPFILRLAECYKSISIVGIPYSVNNDAVEMLKKYVEVVVPNEVSGVAGAIKSLCESHARTDRLLIQDIGGYATEMVSNSSVGCANLLGVVEDTNNGHWRYERLKAIHAPVVSIAQSRLKDLENTLIGHSIVYSLEQLLREEFHQPLGGRNILVLGYGKIGRAACNMLRGRSAIVNVWDINPVARAQASLDGFRVAAKESLLQETDIVLGTSGNMSLTSGDAARLRDGVILVSGSSKTVEFDLVGLKRDAKKIERLGAYTQLYQLTSGRSVFLMYGGQPINFIHGSSLGAVLDVVFSSLYECGRLLENGKIKVGVNHIPPHVEDVILETWERVHGRCVGY